MRIIIDGRINHRLEFDPRISKSQLDSLRRVANVDEDAEVVGLDEKFRPVVKARIHARHQSEWALLRNGDPAHKYGKLAESWR